MSGKTLVDSVYLKDSFSKSNSIYLDVRSPREFIKGHVTKSINIPLFSNEEFSDIGSIYKSKGKQEAIDKGLLYASRSMSNIMEAIEEYKNQNIFVYCARGGMRSDAFVWLLDSIGYKASKILGGYKSIRRQVLSSFNLKNEIVIVGGGTGTGKTIILSRLAMMGCNVIDLEEFANHRGSSFGSLGRGIQPTQQQFENDMYFKVIKDLNGKKIFIESESRKIGRLIIPPDLWDSMGRAVYVKILMDIDRRIGNLIKEYGSFSGQELEERVINIKKKLGGENVKKALNYISKSRKRDFCRLLLLCYYDKTYAHSSGDRKNKVVNINASTKSYNKIAKEVKGC